MAKCASCRKPLSVLFWKYANICPECKAARAEFKAKLKELTPVLITTPCLVGLNVLVFVVMVASGISLMTPNAVELVK
jgi:hypothetical protein